MMTTVIPRARTISANLAGLLLAMALTGCDQHGMTRTELPRAEKFSSLVLELDRSWASAVQAQDVTALDHILSDDFQAISGSGELRDKKMEIADETSGDRPEFFRTENQTLHIAGGVVFVVGTLHWRQKGAAADSLRRYTAVYSSGSGGVKMIRLQISGPLKR